MTSKLLIVCDDAGFASVDRGILSLVERTQLPVCAEYLIEQEGAVGRLKEMAQHPLVSPGLHFELSGVTDADRVGMTRELKAKGECLGEQKWVRSKMKTDARRQLATFQDALGKNPSHISTHGNFNVDLTDGILPWWRELMEMLFEGSVPPMQCAMPLVRHNLFIWNMPDTARTPCPPDEFCQRLTGLRNHEAVEFVLHAALPKPGDASLDMLFTADMRVLDTEAAVDILTSDAIERAGFQVISVHDL
jgi:hypothetical protein